jgi:putative SOS response-associated peptidase YedK
VPFHFTLKGSPLFALAGIWEIDRDKAGKEQESFAIITTAANKIMAPIHDRMPVIIERRKEADWLLPQLTLPKIYELLDSPASKNLETFEASPKLNSAKYDEPALAHAA